MKPPATVTKIFDALDRHHPNADTELVHRNAYELLVATILSAQSTDVRVNLVTPSLFERYPDADEGVLTGLRAQLVNTDALADWAREHEISEALLLGRGAEGSNLRGSNNVLADFVEALIAATYLDAGLDAARAVCARLVGARLDALAKTRMRLDPKTELQQRFQALGGTAPTYAVVDSGGPAHDRWFVVRVRLGEQWGAEGKGRSKRLAEREAARLTLAEDSWHSVLSPTEGKPPPDSRLEEA